MVLWVKEYKDKLNVWNIMSIAKSNIKVERLVSNDDVGSNDLIVLSEMDKEYNASEYNFARSVVYENLLEKMQSEVEKEYHYRYDYYYLKSRIEKANNPNINTIITGSSYGLWDIDEEKLENSVNFSLGSQDLYYSTKVVKTVCNNNKRISNVLILCTYYYFFSDLSLEKDIYALSKLSTIYKPLLNDIHNAIIVPPKKTYMSDSEVFDYDKVLEVFCNKMKDAYYFNAIHPREEKWETYSMEERYRNAFERANSHNKNLKYIHSFEENKTILTDFSQYCQDKGIRLYVVSVPLSTKYRELLDDRLINAYYNVLDSDDLDVEVLDLTESTVFTEEDYYDADHLNKYGARKFTEIINAELEGTLEKIW